MAPRSSGSDDRDPFEAFCDDLSKALGKKSGPKYVAHRVTRPLLTISRLPKNTMDKMNQFIKDNREEEDVFSEELIGVLVSILEGGGSSGEESIPEGSVGARNLQSHEDIPLNVKSLSYLDSSTWIAVVQTLLLAQRCRSAERGVYLLAVGLITTL